MFVCVCVCVGTSARVHRNFLVKFFKPFLHPTMTLHGITLMLLQVEDMVPGSMSRNLQQFCWSARRKSITFFKRFLSAETYTPLSGLTCH